MNASENMQRTAPTLGAYHSCDTAFTFGTVPDATPVDEQLTRNVHDYWFSFVRDGVPSGEQLWLSYTAEPRTEMLFGVPLSKRVGAALNTTYAACAAWYTVYEAIYARNVSVTKKPLPLPPRADATPEHRSDGAAGVWVSLSLVFALLALAGVVVAAYFLYKRRKSRITRV